MSTFLEAKRVMIQAIVEETKGKTFSVTFKRKTPKVDKETGETEEFCTFESCRTGVKKHLKGGKSTISDKKDLIGVYIFGRNELGQFQEKGYRCFSADLVTKLVIPVSKGVTKTITFD